jgi:hypothetical protein
MHKLWTVGAAAIVALILSGCGGGGHNNNSNGLTAVIPVANVTAGTNFSFDISGVDSARGRMYFTDRNNKSVDVIDIASNTHIKSITGGFAGCNTGPTCAGANNGLSGPDGLNIIPGTTLIYVGDVNSVKIVDTQTDSVVKTIAIGGTSGNRADEGCYDPDHKIFMINSPEESPPFATFIDTTSQKIIANPVHRRAAVHRHHALGPEAAYDHASASFITNNDGSTANPNGEVDVIPVSFIMAGTSAVADASRATATNDSRSFRWQLIPPDWILVREPISRCPAGRGLPACRSRWKS